MQTALATGPTVRYHERIIDLNSKPTYMRSEEIAYVNGRDGPVRGLSHDFSAKNYLS